MRILLVAALIAVLIACGGKAKPNEPIASAPPPSKLAKIEPAKVAGPVFRVEMIASTSGVSMEATLRDPKLKEPLMGATVVLTSPALVGEQVNITDENGRISFSSLPPGDYTMTVYYSDQTAVGKFKAEKGKIARVAVDWDLSAQAGEIVTIEAPEEPKFATSIEALSKGAIGQAVALGEAELAKQPSSKLHGQMAIARYTFAWEKLRVETMALGRQLKKGEDLRKGVASFLADMDKVQAHLATAAKDPKFVFELCVACMATQDTYFMLVPPGALDIERDKSGQPLPEGDKRRRPTYRFDHGDLIWARAFIHFHQGFANLALAYDFSFLDQWLADEDDLSSDTPKPKPTKITIKLADAKRVAQAKEHFLAGLVASDEARAAYLAETDDDREWVPSPKQKSYASPLAVDDKLYKSWQDILGDVRLLVTGETGVAFKAIWSAMGSKSDEVPPGFLDIGGMLAKPKDIVFDLALIDKIEAEKNRGKRDKLTIQMFKNILGNGYKPTMKASKLTERLLQIQKGVAGSSDAFEDKLKYLLWLN